MYLPAHYRAAISHDHIMLPMKVSRGGTPHDQLLIEAIYIISRVGNRIIYRSQPADKLGISTPIWDTNLQYRTPSRSPPPSCRANSSSNPGSCLQLHKAESCYTGYKTPPGIRLILRREKFSGEVLGRYSRADRIDSYLNAKQQGFRHAVRLPRSSCRGNINR